MLRGAARQQGLMVSLCPWRATAITCHKGGSANKSLVTVCLFFLLLLWLYMPNRSLPLPVCAPVIEARA